MLKNDVELLKVQISKMEQLLRSRQSMPTFLQDQSPHEIYQKMAQSESTDSKKILDKRFKTFKKNCIFYKKSRFLYFGPLSIRSIMNYEPKCTILFLQIKSMMDSERRAWKGLNAVSFPSGNIGSIDTIDNDEDGLIEDIKLNFMIHFDAILERLKFFENHLNKLLMNDIVDMSLCYSYFTSFFKRDSSGKVNFIKPEKKYSYADMALLMALVKMTILFTLDEKDKFEFPYDDAYNKLNFLALRALGVARFQRKQHISSLLALYAIRLNIYTFDRSVCDGGDGSNAYPSFQIILNMCFQMGLHRSMNSIYSLYQNQTNGTALLNVLSLWKKLWRSLRFLDAAYALQIGCPLAINDDFCDAHESNGDNTATEMDRAYIQLTDLMREASTLFNSVRPISINQIINICERFFDFMNKCSSFKQLLFDNPGDDIVSTAWICDFKLRALDSILSFERMLTGLLKDPSLFKSESGEITEGEKKVLQELHEKFETKAVIISLMNLRIIERLTASDSIFKNNHRFMLFFKSSIKTLLVRTVMTIMCHILNSPEFDENKVTDLPYIKFDTIDYDLLERSLSGKAALSGEEQDYLNHLLARFKCPKQFVKFLFEFYQLVIQQPLLSKDYGFFICFKYISIFCYFLESANSYKQRNPISKKASTTNGDYQLKLNEIIRDTKMKLAANTTLGVIDRTWNVFSDVNEMDSFLQSVFESDLPCDLFSTDFKSDDTSNFTYGFPSNNSSLSLCDCEVHSTNASTSNTNINVGTRCPEEDEGDKLSGSYQLFF
ncbi:hypothetical protein CANARDRAFT_195123 [[Candida] arabinofermentans NRRL YB-2248]|uniref:Transcription factor domain-containing protein n=1 Tax=[Candida] arabinofermentans NRRL YB-2248 TaxID=983967 RepID=A0A1E4T6U6_9ASCO|nr:hypothetical protein CANARDRAFT_195123 [[Candida] arabinofermentans NRRL YB-2248]